MKNITIFLPDSYVMALDKLRDLGILPSKSEGIRRAIVNYVAFMMDHDKTINNFLEMDA